VPKLVFPGDDTEDTFVLKTDNAKAPEGKSVFDKGRISKFIDDHPIIRRAISGPTKEEVGGHDVIGMPQDDSFLPEMKEPAGPESFLHYAGRGLYNNVVRPLGSVEGLVGASQPEFGGAKIPEVLPPEVKPLQRALPLRSVNAPRQLGPAVNEPIIPQPVTKPSFIAGRAGVAKNQPYKLDTGPLNPAMGNREVGTVMPHEYGDIAPISPELAAENGLSLGRGLPRRSIVERPQGTYSGAGSINELLGRTEEVRPDINRSYIESGNARPGEPQIPSAEPKGPISRLRPVPEAPVNPNRNMGAGVKTITDPSGAAARKILKDVAPTKAEAPLPSIAAPDADPKTVVKSWANGREAAHQFGINASKDFAELSDPKLIQRFQAGDRTGKLAEVQKHFDTLLEAEKAAGVIDKDVYKNNYLRHYWQESPADVDKIFAKIVAKNPAFSKQSVFQNYAEGIAAGLHPKYSTLPEIIGARTAESVRAIKNKQMYNWLERSGLMRKGATIPDTLDVDKIRKIFINPDEQRSAKLIKYMQNYLGDSSPVMKAAGDAGSITKNIYLGGGIPWTKYNMHAWNIARSDMKLRGIIPAAKDFLSDPTGRKAVQIFDDKGSRDFMAKLMEHGYQYHAVADAGKAVQPTGKNIVSRFGAKALDTEQKVFEAPLFERALPALKLKASKGVYANLVASGMKEEEALKATADIANEFYGGMNKVVRDKSGQDAMRAILLAPDWLESRVKLALNDWKGTAKTIAGKGSAVDKLHAKSFVRGSIATGIGGLASYQGSNRLRNPNNVVAIPAGQSGNKDRNVDILGSADEGQRIPLQVPLRMYQGNPAAALDLLVGNRLSQPLNSAINTVKNIDQFGNPLRNKDRYGRPISFARGSLNTAEQMSKPFQPQLAQGLINLAKGDSGLEEALAQGAELPIRYNREPTVKSRKGLPRFKF
jgi:hypothetical protein